MRVLGFVFVACLAATVSAMAVDKSEQSEVDPRIINFLTDFYNQLIAEPINTLTSALASMSVHLVAGIAQEGLGGLTGLLGKRGVFDDLITSAQSSLYQMLNQAVQNIALSLTQALVNFSQNGSLGKRNVEKVNFGQLGSSLLGVLTNGLYDIGNQLTQNVGVVLTQLLLTIANGGSQKGISSWVSNVGSILGSGLNSLVQATALEVATLLLHISENGVLPTIGK